MIENDEHNSGKYYVRMPSGALGAYTGGDIKQVVGPAQATPMSLDQAADIASAVGGGVVTFENGQMVAVQISPEGTLREQTRLPNKDILPKAITEDPRFNQQGYPKAYAADPLPEEELAPMPTRTQRKRQNAKDLAKVDKELFGAPLHGDPDDVHPEAADLISSEVRA